MKARTLPGFTLVELIIVMILTGILVGLAGGVFYYLNSYRIQVDRKAIPLNTVSRLEYVLRRDVEESQTIIAEEDLLKCYFASDSVIYQSVDTVLLRRQAGFTESFEVVVSFGNFVLTDDRLEQFEVAVIDERKRINRYYFAKQYGLAAIINQKPTP